MKRPHGDQVIIDPENPQHTALCMRCGSPLNRFNLHSQRAWSGKRLIDSGFKFCEKCLDIPNTVEQLIILPPDPSPIFDALQGSFPMDMITHYTISSPLGLPMFGLNSSMTAHLYKNNLP